MRDPGTAVLLRPVLNGDIGIEAKARLAVASQLLVSMYPHEFVVTLVHPSDGEAGEDQQYGGHGKQITTARIGTRPPTMRLTAQMMYSLLVTQSPRFRFRSPSTERHDPWFRR